ncbi:hypothetical protein CCHR01_01589 [Colletotrichum chrysophilum]|uniref:Uncharacterized protein n=1 Tax=Colletotrichum chrysophilum TaxID=1836956 RepID=A0AAD9AXA0_9PEZI|nr:hypothetical protein CCHR01_01589 [Colletotrichum chrysophilum]
MSNFRPAQSNPALTLTLNWSRQSEPNAAANSCVRGVRLRRGAWSVSLCSFFHFVTMCASEAIDGGVRDLPQTEKQRKASKTVG